MWILFSELYKRYDREDKCRNRRFGSTETLSGETHLKNVVRRSVMSAGLMCSVKEQEARRPN